MAKKKTAAPPPPIMRTRYSIVMPDTPFRNTRVFADGVELHGVVSVDREDERLRIEIIADHIEVMGSVGMAEMFIANNKGRT